MTQKKDKKKFILKKHKNAFSSFKNEVVKTTLFKKNNSLILSVWIFSMRFDVQYFVCYFFGLLSSFLLLLFATNYNNKDKDNSPKKNTQNIRWNVALVLIFARELIIYEGKMVDWLINFDDMSNRLGLFMPRGYGISFITFHICIFSVVAV